MTSPDPQLFARAHRAYEWSRVLHGATRAWPAAVVLGAALALHVAAWPRAAFVAAALAVALAAAAWRGGGWARGAWPGILGGAPAFFVPSFVMPAGTACDQCAHPDAHWSTCLATCALVSLVAGGVVAWRARRDPEPRAYVSAAAVTAILTASVTCAMAGLTSTAGVAIGVIAASLPVVLARPVARPA